MKKKLNVFYSLLSLLVACNNDATVSTARENIVFDKPLRHPGRRWYGSLLIWFMGVQTRWRWLDCRDG